MAPVRRSSLEGGRPATALAVVANLDRTCWDSLTFKPPICLVSVWLMEFLPENPGTTAQS